MADENILEGIDVSYAQGVIDWKTLADSKKVFYAFCKATEGQTSKDPQFKNNWQGIKSVGLIRGAYHFAHPDEDANDAVLEADNFVNTVGEIEYGDMLVLDIETANNIPRGEKFYNWVIAWLERVEERTNVIPFVYTGGPFFNDKAGNKLTEEQKQKLLKYPLWLAAYVKSPDNFVPAIWKSKGWTLWQKSGDVAASGDTPLRVPGIRAVVDRNWFRGTVEDLKALAESLHKVEKLPEVVVDLNESATEAKPAEEVKEVAKEELKTEVKAEEKSEAKTEEKAKEDFIKVEDFFGPSDDKKENTTLIKENKNFLSALLEIVMKLIQALFGKK